MIVWPIGAVTLALIVRVAVAGGWSVRSHLGRLVRAYAHRRKAAMLARFDDRMLADIGLTRSDVRDAFSEPLWRDPTELLTERAGERREWQRPRDRLAPPTISAPPLVPPDGLSRPSANRPARLAL